MEKTAVQKLARVLRIFITITFVCNLLVLPIVPGMVSYSVNGGFEQFAEFWAYEWDDALWDLFFHQTWWASQYTMVLTLFLWVCGACTAVILWQARRVLGTILAGNPFQCANAGNMKRAAVCCLVISAAALARTVWGLCFYRSIQPLFTYNALFVPIFAMGFLLCMVMSALFRQANQLKEENDLTI